MLTASPVESLAGPVSPHALVLARRADTDDLGETIAALAARLHAATYELLVLLREFDERKGWNNGFLSCAHWLHWRTGIDLGAAREKVRVAKALPALPRISAAMQLGQVSYAKVRALTRVATPENERSLLDLDHGALYVSTETSQRLSCDASLVQMRHDADGAVLDVGRKTRTIPPSIRRALAARDTGCRFPGCTSRRCDAHHVNHWSDGGATRLDNLVLLCRRHHRAVHEDGFAVIRGLDGVLAFLRPDGKLLQVAPAAPFDLPGLQNAMPGVTEKLPTWDGTRFDLPWAIDVIRFNTAVLGSEQGL